MPRNSEEFLRRVAVPRLMKTASPSWTRGDFRGVLGVTHNLAWVSIGEPTLALPDRCRSVKASQAFTPSDGGDFQGQ
jgi:hypothetical protein